MLYSVTLDFTHTYSLVDQTFQLFVDEIWSWGAKVSFELSWVPDLSVLEALVGQMVLWVKLCQRVLLSRGQKSDVVLLEKPYTLGCRHENPNSQVELPLADEQRPLNVLLCDPNFGLLLCNEVEKLYDVSEKSDVTAAGFAARLQDPNFIAQAKLGSPD